MTDPQLLVANGAVPLTAQPPPENAATKRQRRPSVRLGDIGDQTFDSLSHRRPKPSSRDPGKGPRGRNPANYETLWRVTDSKPKAKRVRSNWGFDDVDDEDEEYEEEEERDSSPVQSLENRVSDTNWNGGERIEGERIGGERNGIRVWLNQLGLGRYAPVFEIHEVDDEVLPMLTIEDLKDMGINAVGSRRKMYCAIQKLSKGFS